MAALPASRLLLPREAEEGWSSHAATCTLRRSLTFSDRSEFGWSQPRGEVRRYCSLPRRSERPLWLAALVAAQTSGLSSSQDVSKVASETEIVAETEAEVEALPEAERNVAENGRPEVPATDTGQPLPVPRAPPRTSLDSSPERRMALFREARGTDLSQGKEWGLMDEDDYRRLVFLGSSDSEGEGERLDWDYFESGPVGCAAVAPPATTTPPQLVPVPFPIPVPVPVFVPVLLRAHGYELMPALREASPPSPAIIGRTSPDPEATIPSSPDASPIANAPPQLLGIMSQFIEEERKVYSDLEALCQEAVSVTEFPDDQIPDDWVEPLEWSGTESAGDPRLDGADDDSWLEASTTEEEDDDPVPQPEYCRAAIDLTLHTIVEESCEESELEATPTDLEKYFFYGLGGGAPDSATSSECGEIPEQPAATTSRLEKYFLSEFMGFGGRRDSDGSVGSDSEGRPSPSQRRKRLVRPRPRDDHDTEPFTEGQFDTVKRTKKKKRGSPAPTATDGAEPEGEGSGRESEPGKHESRDSGFMGSQDDLEAAPPPRPPRPLAAALSRNDSFNWSSDEETNLMMTKMRAFFRTMVGGRAARGEGAKPAQLAYFESELTRLMKSVPGLREEQVKEIVEYLSSEDTWSDSYDSSDYTGSDLEAKTAEASPPLMERVMQHIGTRLVALMHEVSESGDDAWLPRSKSSDPLLEESRAEPGSDNERFSWRGSFESALLADSRTGLGRRSAGDLGEELGLGVATASSLPRLPSLAPAAAMARGEAASLPRLPTSPPHATIYKSHSAASVKSARYRAPGYRPAPPRHRYRSRNHHAAHSGGEESETSAASGGTVTPTKVAPLVDDSDSDATLPRVASLKMPSTCSHFHTIGSWRSDSLASVYSGAGEGRAGGVAVRGEVQFGLEFNYKLSSLEIHVKQCRDLAPVDTKRGRSDPYVKVYLLPDKSKSGKRKTKVKKHTLNPVFEETLRFQTGGTKGLEGRTLWLSVWHSDMFGRNDFLGEVLMPLENKVFDDPLPKWYPLQERSEALEELHAKGELIVGLKFACEGNTTKGTLYVLIKDAKNLPAAKSNGTSDPFCKSYLLPDKGKVSKKKSPVASKTCNPVWNTTLRYDNVTLADLMERSLELTIWHHDRLASNEFLGGVRLSLGTGRHRGRLVDWMDATGNEVTLWQRMADKQNFWVESCLPLRPSLDTVRTTSLLHNTL